MKNLINSLLIILLCFGALGQFKTKKYIKRNKKALITSYSDGQIYARGIFADSSRMFIGNSDGSLYYLNLKKANSKLVFKLPDFDELRDVEFVNDKIIGLHSGNNGMVLYMDLKGATKVIKLCLLSQYHGGRKAPPGRCAPHCCWVLASSLLWNFTVSLITVLSVTSP